MKIRIITTAGILIILFLMFSGTVLANDKKQLNSNGRIEFDNQTPDDPTDDVVFDARDLSTLEKRVHELEIKTATLGEALK